MPKQIAVIGGRTADKKLRDKAELTGKLIAKKGWQLICGGLSGIMDACAKGASSANGTVIGILPGANRNEANQHISIVIATGIGIARNSIIAHTADAAIAIDGAYGTLSEIAYFLQLGKPVVILDSKWDIEGTIKTETPEEAVFLLEKYFLECERELGQ